MKRLLARLVIGVVFTTFAAGQEGGASVEFKRRANQWMVSPDAAKRKAAYRSWLQLGKGGLAEYRQALETAAKYHSKRLDELSRGRFSANPYEAHQEQAKQLDEERTRVMPLIKTDWKKDPAKVAMLREEMSQLDKLWTRVNRLAAVDTKRFDADLDAAVGGLMEVAREQERFDKESDTADLDDKDLRAHVLKNHVEGSFLLPQRERFEATRTAAAELAKVEKENADAGRWATAAMKSFATLLNRERCITGLIPLRLEEKLHDATQGHSEDMARLGFFAHESPVEGKKTPWDRARLAGFEGHGAGENIFMGSASPNSAYNAWFGSDGHRFIMFGGGNVLGVGVSGVHWTMMTGNKS
ncbi:MAG: CAP domain-containing protein [Akkermansiaceae bacterium]|nr:CAP domain-containing protein [Akkermansiaceae bacterium]MCF7732882.1 CAP domain-containing protein [Akkermansiaceae bacterium]